MFPLLVMVCGEFIIHQKGGHCSFYLQTSEKSRFLLDLETIKQVVFDTTSKNGGNKK